MNHDSPKIKYPWSLRQILAHEITITRDRVCCQVFEGQIAHPRSLSFNYHDMRLIIPHENILLLFPSIYNTVFKLQSATRLVYSINFTECPHHYIVY